MSHDISVFPNAQVNIKPQGGGGRATTGDLTIVYFPWVRNGLRFDITQVPEAGVI